MHHAPFMPGEAALPCLMPTAMARLVLLSLRLRYSRGFCKAKGSRMRAPRAVALSQVANPPRLGARLGCRVVEVEGKKIGGGPGPGLAAAMSARWGCRKVCTAPEKLPRLRFGRQPSGESRRWLWPDASPGGMVEQRGWSGCEVRSEPCVPMGGIHQGHAQGNSYKLPHHHRED